MLYTVYILQSEKDQKLYVGMTKDLPHRIKEHNLGRVNSTRCRRPLKLIYIKVLKGRLAARAKEKYYKSGAGREKIKKMLADLPMDKSDAI